MRLDDIGKKYGTGKSSEFHDFLRYYEVALAGKQIKSVLEIGIGAAAQSLRMWSEFYPHANIYGFDINPQFLINEGNIRSFLCDQSNIEGVRRIIQDNGINPDVFVDDGPHIWSFQISTYKAIWSLLKSGAIYIVEDLHTSCIWPQCWKDQEERPLDFFFALKHFAIIKTNWDKLTNDEISALNTNKSINYLPLNDNHADDLRKVGIVGIGIK